MPKNDLFLESGREEEEIEKRHRFPSTKARHHESSIYFLLEKESFSELCGALSRDGNDKTMEMSFKFVCKAPAARRFVININSFFWVNIFQTNGSVEDERIGAIASGSKLFNYFHPSSAAIHCLC